MKYISIKILLFACAFFVSCSSVKVIDEKIIKTQSELTSAVEASNGDWVYNGYDNDTYDVFADAIKLKMIFGGSEFIQYKVSPAISPVTEENKFKFSCDVDDFIILSNSRTYFESSDRKNKL